MFWNRNRNECEIYVIDLVNQLHTIKVKLDVTPEEILQNLHIEDAYLVLDGIMVSPTNLKKYLREGSTFYACKIKEKGW